MSELVQPGTLLGRQVTIELIVLAKLAPRGAIVEVGVYKGGSAWHLAEVARDRRLPLHLFDTFTGMPHAGWLDSHPMGHFADTSLDEVKAKIPDAHFHPGLFPETLPESLTQIGFAHIDCDQYQSVRACIDHLTPRMVDGGIMLFDDYKDVPACAVAVDEAYSAFVKRTAEKRAFIIVTPVIRRQIVRRFNEIGISLHAG